MLSAAARLTDLSSSGLIDCCHCFEFGPPIYSMHILSLGTPMSKAGPRSPNSQIAGCPRASLDDDDSFRKRVPNALCCVFVFWRENEQQTGPLFCPSSWYYNSFFFLIASPNTEGRQGTRAINPPPFCTLFGLQPPLNYKLTERRPPLGAEHMFARLQPFIVNNNLPLFTLFPHGLQQQGEGEGGAIYNVYIFRYLLFCMLLIPSFIKWWWWWGLWEGLWRILKAEKRGKVESMSATASCQLIVPVLVLRSSSSSTFSCYFYVALQN